jgi:hypothetical protein
MTRFLPLAAALLLAGCVPSTTTEQAAPVTTPPAPTLSRIGLESVLGKDARVLEAQFGRPELDIREGSARKLQFANQVCILDAYLYPSRQGAEPLVTHVDARYPDGRDFDRASCVASLSAEVRSR